ncbi:hypothetical protein CCR94_15835 [Rhodoblastus sphagnicola]|uniref:histidine kinase n=1 Tax=Rhodoblastus sphagnicola TaxID=333368 RepID=A0A2S6N3T0_9HYPH|nr:PAS domain-containing sensor histidine kinase [Rhodoblastus sphagnicola]MBB4198916.1 signal transduction histidine kinase [Rhodoblastus sphagnicola]PPQ29278.1 hypothetical protein CCR94_15835 [Rhodoblastus sphagnicola]
MTDDCHQTSANLVRALLTVSTDCLKLMDADGRLLEMNPCGLKLMEIEDFSTVRDQPSTIFWPEETQPTFLDALHRARNGLASSFSAFCPTAKGDARWWDVTVLPIFNARGEVVWIFAALRDATHAQMSEKSPRDTIKDKEEAPPPMVARLESESLRLQAVRAQIGHAEKLRLLGQFVGSVVHDINNVLSSMSGAARLIRRVAADERTLDILNPVDQAVSKGARLVRQLLDFSRTGPSEPEVLEVAMAIKGDADLMRHFIGHGVQLELNCEDGLWPILVSPGELQSVIFNLLGNARDALDGEGRVEVSARNRPSVERLRGLPAGDYVEIAVTDNGPGITPEVLARLGEPFFTTKAKGKGTGLGVHSAFELAKACRGMIEINSASGMGARISLHLPRAGAAGDMMAAAAPQPTVQAVPTTIENASA